MKNKKVVVLAKFFKGELNPFDGAAIECALEMGFTDITVLSMAHMSALNAITALTRLGVKTLLLSDAAYAGSDTLATSYILSEALNRVQPDIIFCGRQSIDGDTAQVPPMIAKHLGFAVQTGVLDVSEGNFILRNGESVTPKEGTVYAFERCRTLRFPSIFSTAKNTEVWDNQTLNLPVEKCGLSGSPTRVVKAYESQVGRRFCKFISKEELDGVIQAALQRANDAVWVESEEKLQTVCYVGNLKERAEQIAVNAVALGIQGKSLEELASELAKITPQAVLWEDSEDRKIIAAQLAVQMNVGLCADCISFRVESGNLIMTRPAQGGNITADIICPNQMAFATVRTARQDCADVVFSVGNGGVQYLDRIKELAKKYDADTCCSRMVADSGKMPYCAQVGLTGKTVSPKVYVAFGISGAVQHTCAISGAGTVIAVNCDKRAQIFDYADYGIVEEINELL